ncbi:MAG: pyridoxamine 5'-phosphate oxidase [Synoicihabitans sp.]
MPDLADLRKNYALAGLSEDDLADNPFAQFEKWFEAAKSAGVVEPNAMTLATVDESGAPSARTVLLKEMTPAGFTFFTNYESAKARDLANQPVAALVFPWLALERQILIRGSVTKVTREESEDYFHRRPRGSQIGAWASQQSAVVPDRAALEAGRAEIEARYGDGTIPLPPNWGGYRLSPQTVEFWQGRPDRLHDRLRFRRDGDRWIVERLSP